MGKYIKTRYGKRKLRSDSDFTFMETVWVCIFTCGIGVFIGTLINYWR